MPFLFDTNIFLEILLNQDKKEKAKNLINIHLNQLFISDFSLHSIGVVLIKQKKFSIFKEFLHDLIPHVTVLSLPKDKYPDLNKIAQKYDLDFDDPYQTAVAKEFDLAIITMDNDFKKS
ncbi:MAG: PIN domain-containing protein [Bacteroidales bacterium]|nr:PIN domain-containing protein [Bacteroidales bacterium]